MFSNSSFGTLISSSYEVIVESLKNCLSLHPYSIFVASAKFDSSRVRIYRCFVLNINLVTFMADILSFYNNWFARQGISEEFRLIKIPLGRNMFSL